MQKNTNNRLTYLLFLIIFSISFQVKAQFERLTLSYSEFTSGTCNQPNPPVFDGATFSQLQLGAGITCNYTSTDPSLNTTGYTANSTFNTAVANDEYLYFTITANADACQALLDTIIVSLRRSSTGPQKVQFAYKLNGGTLTPFGNEITDITTSIDSATPGKFVIFSPPIFLAPNDNLEIRMYAYGGTSTAGTLRIRASEYLTFKGGIRRPVEAPIFDTNITPENVCQGTSSSTVKATAKYSSSISYSLSPTSAGTINANTGVITWDSNFSGTATLTATAFGTDCNDNPLSISANKPIEVLPKPTTPTIIANGATTFCQGGSVILTSSLGNSYLWSNNQTTSDITVNSNGSFTVRTISAAGCTSDVSQPTIVTVNLPSDTSITDSICSGASFVLGTQTLTASGNYTATFTNQLGCDSTVNLNLTVISNDTTVLNESICNGSSFLFNNQNITTAGTYFDTLTAANGCDSIITLNLTVLPVATTTLNDSVCSNALPFIFGSQNLSVSGTYFDTLTAANGCDSIITLNLTVLPVATTTLNESICAGNSYLFNNQVLTNSGTYSAALSATNGCDSIVTLNLIVNPIPIADAGTDVTIEWGESITLNGSGGSSYTWTPSNTLNDSTVANPIASNTETTTYSLVVTENGCTSLPDTVTVAIQPFRIPNGFTPNGDGVNDTWKIPSIKRFPQAEIEVYNRYGQRVFRSDRGYTKEWDGKNEQGNILPFGTYYYLFKPNDSIEENRSGWIMILK